MDRLITKVGTAAAVLLLASLSSAGTLELELVDAGGAPAGSVVVMAMPASVPPDNGAATTREPVVMDQVDEQFVPQLLVVEAGSPVSFPNSDQVRHHVYSFSEPKRFELPLYRGNQHAPIIFDRAGLVVLGCNIHDHMVGYILVAETPYFAVSDAAGRASLTHIPDGTYGVRVWHPGMEVPVTAQSGLTVQGAATHLTIAVDSGWQNPRSKALTWNDY